VRYELKQYISYSSLRSWIVAGLSPRRPVFNPMLVHVIFVVNKVTLTEFSPRTSVFLFQYHATIAPYSFYKFYQKVKRAKTVNLKK